MAKPTLLPDPSCLHLQLLDASEAAITVVVTTTSEEAECPLCHGRSARIHSRYVRAVAGLPWMGCAVRLQLHVRRFFCTNPECAREIFTERLPTVVAPSARRTMRLTDVFIMYHQKRSPLTSLPVNFHFVNKYSSIESDQTFSFHALLKVGDLLWMNAAKLSYV